MKSLTINESMLLLTIWRLGEEAYGVKIRDKVSEYSLREVGFGSLYNNLDQLVRKGYTSSYKGEPTAARGGKRKVYYNLTKKGLEALQNARELQHKLWSNIPDMAFIKDE